MKIRDLGQGTRVSKETIHYRIGEDLLPKPRKLGRNIADYNKSCRERIHLIKELRDHYFLPLAVIKNILNNQKSPCAAKTIETGGCEKGSPDGENGLGSL